MARLSAVIRETHLDKALNRKTNSSRFQPYCCSYWFGHVARRSDDQLIMDLLDQANWGPSEDVGNHDQGRPGIRLRTASLRLRTIEKGLGESL